MSNEISKNSTVTRKQASQETHVPATNVLLQDQLNSITEIVKATTPIAEKMLDHEADVEAAKALTEDRGYQKNLSDIGSAEISLEEKIKLRTEMDRERTKDLNASYYNSCESQKKMIEGFEKLVIATAIAAPILLVCLYVAPTAIGKNSALITKFFKR